MGLPGPRPTTNLLPLPHQPTASTRNALSGVARGRAGSPATPRPPLSIGRGAHAYDHVQDPLLDYDDALNPRGIANYAGYANPAVIGLLAKAKAESDPVKRAEIVVQIQDQYLKDLPSIPLLAPYTTVFQRSGLTGAPLTYTYQGTAWATMLGAA
jgi:ABC-type transport system substrate-binding protein